MTTTTKHAPDDDLSEGALQGSSGFGPATLILQGSAAVPRASSGRRARGSPRRPTSSTASRSGCAVAVIGDAGACRFPRAAGERSEASSPDRDSEALEIALIRAVFGGRA